jgi:hypothetical protein
MGWHVSLLNLHWTLVEGIWFRKYINVCFIIVAADRDLVFSDLLCISWHVEVLNCPPYSLNAEYC